MVPRIEGFIGSTGEVRGGDLLRSYAKSMPNVVTRDEFTAWKTLRNPLAHGEFGGDSQLLLTRQTLTCNLINKLVLKAVGYKGQFIDYSSHDWRTSIFEG